jgi:hypothetical protein
LTGGSSVSATDRLSATATSSSSTVPAYGFTGLAVLASADEEEIASATTTDPLGSAALFNRISGTTTITSLGSATNRLKVVRFTGVLLLAHHATSLILPTSADITTAVGDTMVVTSDNAGNARVVAYQRADGSALSGVTLAGSQTLTNKTLTSPVLNTGLSGTAFLDEDDMTSDSASKAASQQSIKAYVDGDVTGRHTIVIPAGAMTAATTSGATPAQIEETTNKHNYPVLDFDASADEYACFSIPMPKGWDEGTVLFRVWWQTSGAVTTGVAWGLQGASMSDNVVIDTAYGTAVVVTDDGQGAANELLVSAESAAVTISGAPTEGDLSTFRIFRDVSDANDDLTQDARLIAVQLFYTTNASDDT